MQAPSQAPRLLRHCKIEKRTGAGL